LIKNLQVLNESGDLYDPLKKIAKILLSDQAEIKLADFGGSSCFANISASETVGKSSFHGYYVVGEGVDQDSGLCLSTSPRSPITSRSPKTAQITPQVIHVIPSGKNTAQ